MVIAKLKRRKYNKKNASAHPHSFHIFVQITHMKQYISLLLCMLLLSCTKLFAQKKLEGIGEFKINKTRIEELPTITGLPLHVYSEYRAQQLVNDYYAAKAPHEDEPFMFETVVHKDSTAIGKTFEPTENHLPYYRIVRMNMFNIAGMQIQHIRMLFYKDVLIELQCVPIDNLSIPMEVNYGKAKIINDEIKKGTCTEQATGFVNEVEELTFTETWQQKDVAAYFTRTRVFDAECKSKVIGTFSIGSVKEVKRYLDTKAKLLKQVEKQKYEKF